MKSSAKYIALISTSALAGAALFTLSNASFTAALRGDTIAAVAASLALVGFAARDYSRQVKPLSVPAHVLRPTQSAKPSSRFFTYSNATSRSDRLAA